MSDFTAKIIAELDTKGIDGQIKDLQNHISSLKPLEIDLKLSKDSLDIGALNNILNSGLAKAGTNAGQSFVKSLTSSLNNIHLVNGGIGNIKNILQGAGFDKASINSITQDLDKMVLTINKINTTQMRNGNIRMNITGVDELGRAVTIVRDFDKETGNVVNTTKRFSQSFKQASKEVAQAQATLTKSSTLSNNIEAWMKQNVKAAEEFGSELRDLQQLLNGNTDSAMFKDVSLRFSEIKSKAKAAGLTVNTFSKSLKDAVKQLLNIGSTVAVIQQVVQVLRKMYDAVYDIDTALTELYKVTDESGSRYAQYLDNAKKSAQELGRNVSSYVKQTATWSKLGYSLSDAEKLSKISSIYANVGEVSDETAVSDLVTAMKAFNLEASDSISIVDALNELGNRFATSAEDLGTGLSRSASSLHAAGVDLNQTLALLTGGAEITQNADEFGNFLKISSMRIRGMKGELEDLGEDVDDSVNSISKVQTQILNLTHGKVNIFDSKDEFRNYYEIMKDISEVYNELSSTEQASLTEILFGKQRGNQGSALIQAFQSGQIEKAYQTALNSAGSAYKEQERWMGSLEAKTAQLEAAWQSLSDTVLNSDFLKGLVDSGTIALNTLDKIISSFGTLNTLLIGFATYKGIKSVS